MNTECEVQHILSKKYMYPLYKDLQLVAQEKDKTCEHIMSFSVHFAFWFMKCCCYSFSAMSVPLLFLILFKNIVANIGRHF